MSIIVYYMSPDPGGQDLFPMAECFGDTELSQVLPRVEALRKMGKTHVCISSELSGSVGKPGVSSVEDGKTPDGHTYDWKKRRV